MYSFLCCMMWLPPISPLTVSLFPTTALFRLLPRQRPVGRIGGGHIGQVRHGERRRGRGCSRPPERVIVLARRLAFPFERHHASRRAERPPRDDGRWARQAKDRQDVVSGKRGRLRVVMGVRSIIKEKKIIT